MKQHTFELRVGHKEQSTEIIIKPVASLAAKSENVIVLEAESQLKDNAKHTANVISEQIVLIDSTDSVAIVDMKDTIDKAISAKFEYRQVKWKTACLWSQKY